MDAPVTARPESVPPALTLLQHSASAREGVLVLMFGALTAVAAQLEVPFYPVPLTGQVLVVLVAAGALGPRLALYSQLAYLGFGIAGAPVFAGGKAGGLALLGPTGGYLVGFPIAAWLAGVLAERARSRVSLFLALACGALAVLVLGACGVAAWSLLTQEGTPSGALSLAVGSGVLPFLPVDLLKALVATLLVWPLRSRHSASHTR